MFVYTQIFDRQQSYACFPYIHHYPYLYLYLAVFKATTYLLLQLRTQKHSMKTLRTNTKSVSNIIKLATTFYNKYRRIHSILSIFSKTAKKHSQKLRLTFFHTYLP